MVQRDILETLSEGGGHQNEEDLVQENPEYMDKRIRLQLVQTLEREADMEALSLNSRIAKRIRILNDPDPLLFGLNFTATGFSPPTLFAS